MLLLLNVNLHKLMFSQVINFEIRSLRTRKLRQSKCLFARCRWIFRVCFCCCCCIFLSYPSLTHSLSACLLFALISCSRTRHTLFWTFWVRPMWWWIFRRTRIYTSGFLCRHLTLRNYKEKCGNFTCSLTFSIITNSTYDFECAFCAVIQIYEYKDRERERSSKRARVKGMKIRR